MPRNPTANDLQQALQSAVEASKAIKVASQQASADIAAERSKSSAFAATLEGLKGTKANGS